ncbi:acyl-CoA dehydrogenase family protein [Paenibacillus xylaniclasticus]|uniref:acyl-CoA dehydrogenase family protein n=1 Tax=Paenibacillus xylaniclasticus TaxID=588083 RepID=UPI000FD8C8AA|nr:MULTISPECIES: acyl-CoA dehydrogenase family protein [Paenibacillus]GFN31680.1 butyryl-CoA dehydrogenase [Paenibacillus curdlanolyticus]
MRFELPEELEMLRLVVREFAETEVAPGASGRDEEERFDRSLFTKMAELGLTGIPVPERYGGSAAGWLAYVIVLEELARVCVSTSAVLAAHTAYTVWPLYRYGSDSIRDRLLQPYASGAQLGGAGLYETSNSAASSAVELVEEQRLNVVEEEAGGLVLQGTHPFVLNAGEADGYFILAPSRQTRRLHALWLSADAPGLTAGNRHSKLGLRAFATGELLFQACRIESGDTVGREGRAREMLQPIKMIAALGAAAQSVGAAQGAMAAATRYAKERKQFGAPIGRQQSILFKLADMSVAAEASRLLVYQAAWRLDQGYSAVREASLARTYAAEAAVRTALEAVQIMGGYGYMREFKLERLLRDVKCLETALALGGLEGISPMRSKSKS